MNGYRRVEPAFCRGCGERWVPGADLCPSCGEVLFRAAPSAGDPRAALRLRAVLVAAAILVVARWATIVLTADDHTLFDNRWLLLPASLCVTAVLASRAWYPGRLPRALHLFALHPAWLVAGLLGVLMPTAFALAIGLPPDGVPLLTPEAESWYAGHGFGWVAIFVTLIVFEEAMFRGLLFDGVQAFAGMRNAAIASALVFAILTLSPAYAVLGFAAVGLRVWSGSIWPPIAMRVAASVVWLLWLQSLLE